MLQQVERNIPQGLNGQGGVLVQPPGLPPGRWVLATPEMAAAWLATGERRNRNLADVSWIKYLMTGGYWMITWDPIMLRKEDRSVGNGQHRLTAQVELGLTLWWFVVENATQEMIDAVDCGRPRKVSDRLAIEGHKNAIAVASRIAPVVKLEGRLRFVGKKVPKQQISDAAERYMEPLDWSFGAIPPGKKGGFSISSYVGAMIFGYRTSPEAVDEFAAKIRTGEMLKRGDPAHTLRQYMTERIGLAGRNASIQLMLATLRALQAELSGDELKQLKPGAFAQDTVDALVARFAVANKG